MKSLKYGLAVALLGTASHAFAQYQVDALRVSQAQPVGTARTLGIGGATTAVGGDYGSVSVNPAGLGMFQRSEFSFSPGLTSLNTSSQAFGATSTDSRGNLNLASAGFVFANRRADGDGNPWRSGAFAIGLTRTASFTQSFRYDGQPDPKQDIFQRLGEDQKANLDDLAYNTYLTDRDKQGTYIPKDFYYTGDLKQGETVRTTGANTQIDLAYGANYLDKLYIGGGIGIVSSRYSSENILTASAVQANDPNSAFASLTLRDALATRGTGVNARLGVIYRPIDAVRIGASVQTPTYIQFTETYNNSLQANFNRPIEIDKKTYTSANSALDPNVFDYAVSTPFKANLGLAVVIGKFGFISGDVEYLDYSSAHLSNYSNNGAQGNHNFSADNQAISNLYASALNLRMGGEFRADIFRVRLGYAHYCSPYQNSEVNQNRNYLTGGVGLRQNNFFLDLAGVSGRSNPSLYKPYTINDPNGETPVVKVTGQQFSTTITAGFLF